MYTSEEHLGMIDAMDEADVRRAIIKVKRGVHVASPVFDGAPE